MSAVCLCVFSDYTSLGQVENYLMLSEYEQNLIKEIEGPPGPLTGRRARKWSLVRQASSLLAEDGGRRRDLSLFRAGWRMNTILEDKDSMQ